MAAEKSGSTGKRFFTGLDIVLNLLQKKKL
jgi:hypothetical protein